MKNIIQSDGFRATDCQNDCEKGQPPDPGPLFARFFAWLAKMGYCHEYSKCKRVWETIIDIDKAIKIAGKSNVIIQTTRKGKKVVRLINKKWAEQWARHYHCQIPHHRQQLPLENIIQLPEKKVKD